MPPLRGMGLIRKILCLRKISDGLRRGGRETEKGDEIMILVRELECKATLIDLQLQGDDK